MVHRLDKVVPEAWIRAGRSFVQNILSVAVVAAGPAVVTAAQGDPTDMGMLGFAGGQAALAAVLAFVHNRIAPVNGPRLGEVPVRAGRSLFQNAVAAAVVSGAYAITTTGGDDLKTLGVAALQAGAAGVISLVYNVVAPRKSEPSETPAEASASGSGQGSYGVGGGRTGADPGADGFGTE
ncbi:hypothetical protein ACIHFD_49225 [Nonomuraea sp. NPDC051941]|uniref:hypothetical protein n=1 Tax=Nonomuraea sp. NPDC051941 TaxID=3364373 RepID=UPI0037C9AAC7